ncbi:MAG: sigma-70 family RNA polymerase sigma factor [Phycisphaerales bacterium]
MAAPAEADLFLRLRACDDEASDELVRLAGGRMLAVARRMLPNEDDADDAVQDAFLSAFKSLEQFDGRSRLTTWLHRITVNACLMKLRSRRRRPERSLDDLLPRFTEDGHAQIPARRWKPEHAAGIEAAERRALVRARIDELPEQHRVVLMLRDIEELDTDETARLLGVSPAAVKTRLHRARQALRTMLNPYFAEELS